jgi:hypothetical protein
MARLDRRAAGQMQGWAHYKPATREALNHYWEIATDKGGGNERPELDVR